MGLITCIFVVVEGRGAWGKHINKSIIKYQNIKADSFAI